MSFIKSKAIATTTPILRFHFIPANVDLVHHEKFTRLVHTCGCFAEIQHYQSYCYANICIMSSVQGNTKISQFHCRDLECILKRKFDDDLTLLRYSAGNLVPLGDNFSCRLLKVDAEIQRSKKVQPEILHVVLKTATNSYYEIDWNILLWKETFMYTRIIPLYGKIDKLYGKGTRKNITSIVPAFYGHRMFLDKNIVKGDEDALIVMENLKTKGYYIEHKRIGLDLTHSTLALKTLAKFHGFGIAAKCHTPSEFNPFKVESDLSGYGDAVLQVAYDGMLHQFRTNPQLQPYSDRIEAVESRRKGVWNAENLRHEPWITIAHGDFWTNNIMFHRDESGKLDDIRIIDFQTYQFADVFMDLVYFLNTSLDDEATSRYFDELIDVYYDELVSVLAELEIDRLWDFGREKFDELLGKAAATEFLRSAMALNLFNTDVNDPDIAVEDFFDILIKCQDSSELCVKKLLRLLKIYERKGWF